MQKFRSSGRGTSPLPRLALTAALLLPLAACDIDNLLDITDPDVVDPTVFTDATALPAFRAAAFRDFAWAFENGQDAQVQYSGMLADEFVNVESFPTRIQIDMRNMDETNSNLQAVVRNLYRSRTMAHTAVDAFHQWGPDQSGLSEVFTLAGLTYTLFGENYCSGVPFSERDASGTFVYGGQETTTQIHTRALVAADSALAAAARFPAPAGNATAIATRARIMNMAMVLRGRALLNLNRPAEAAAAVATVPTGFVFNITHSENTAAENNGIFAFNTLNRRISPWNREGINGLPYFQRLAPLAGGDSVQDPRLPVNRAASGLPAGRAGFSVTPMYDQLKYPSRSAPTPLLTGIEARLIEAEAALRDGDIPGAILIHNTLRMAIHPTTLGVRPLDATGLTTAQAVDIHFRERAYWLWMTSHRLGDMRRLIRQYGRDSEDVFPTGAYFRNVQGGVYGPDVNFPLSVDERNNPEFAGFPSNQSLCLNRDA
jgi:starch-binding outer membrane protein, SusD/RagB family